MSLVKPIYFSRFEIQALLAGKKTQLRRPIRHQRDWVRPAVDDDGVAHGYCDSAIPGIVCPFGHVGSHLWVRETFAPCEHPENHEHAKHGYTYRADWDWFDDSEQRDFAWKPSIHMPRRASRITLEIVNVRVQRLQDIDHRGALAEGWLEANKPDSHGCPKGVWIDAIGDGDDACINWYANLWNQINGPGSWDKNPWVWVLEFKRQEASK
jgi:hypothetical protein